MRIHRELTDYLEHLRTAGLARGDWEAPIAASLLMGALFAEAIGHDVMPDRHGYDVDGIAERFVSLFLVAVGVVPKRAP